MGRDSDIPNVAGTFRKKWMPWVQAVGFLLLVAAVVLVLRQHGMLRDAWASLRVQPAWVIAAIVVLPLCNWGIVTVLFWVLTPPSGRVRLGEMAALIGSAWLLNILPLRPGLMGRVAYHKAVNAIPVKESVKVILLGIVTNAVALAIALTSLAGAVFVRMATPETLAFLAAGTLAVLVSIAWWLRTSPVQHTGPVSAWRFTAGVALRYADYLVWVVRYHLAFAAIGTPLTWPESAGVAAASQVIALLPVQLGPREWGVGLVASFLPSIATIRASTGTRTATGLTADFLNRAAELAVSLPVGLVCTWWVWRQLRAHADDLGVGGAARRR